ncbi:MAG: SRPBCC family protein [Candidatus Limnocylindrales bacterium]
MATSLPPIVLDVETAVGPAEAWAAVTTPERIAEWFTDASPLGSIGTAYRLDFGDGSVVEGVVTELEPGRHFAHTWAWADAEPGQQTWVSWTVEPLENGGSRVTLVHDGWSKAGLDETARDEHEGYWIGYLEDLGAILESAG